MENIQKKLIELGLNSYEASAYSVLLGQKMLTASEISKLGEIPHGRIYNILDSLVKKGFCMDVLGPVKKYEAVRPSIATGKLFEARKKELSDMESFTAQLEETYSSLELNDSPLNYIHVLTSRPVMIDKFNELHLNSKEICRGMNKPPYAQHRTFDEPLIVASPVVETIKSGRIVKGLWEIEKDNIDNFVKWIKFWDKIGEEVRICETLPLKLLIIDDDVAMFTLQNHAGVSKEFTSVVIEHSDITKALIELYEIYWNNAMTPDEFYKTVNVK